MLAGSCASSREEVATVKLKTVAIATAIDRFIRLNREMAGIGFNLLCPTL
jgi:hypothetical protein